MLEHGLLSVKILGAHSCLLDTLSLLLHLEHLVLLERLVPCMNLLLSIIVVHFCIVILLLLPG